ncbi:hypothetical protein FRC10_003151 [Ceratobasidium sp. 414]|nr:hypothetical protein FRC10_003151 [Ceratobasidium sp. 414]
MLIPLLPLLILATSLQGSAFNYLNVADLSSSTSWFFARGPVSQALLGTVILLKLRDVGRMLKPLFPSFATNTWTSVRLEHVPVPSLFYSTAVAAPGPYEPAVDGPSLSLSPGELEPTRLSSAIAPPHSPTSISFERWFLVPHPPFWEFADGLSTSAIPLPFSLSTAPARPTLLALLAYHPTGALPPVGSGEGDLFLPPVGPGGDAGLPTLITVRAIGLGPSTSEAIVSTAVAPVPLPAAAGTPDGRSSRVWDLVLALPLAVHFGTLMGESIHDISACALLTLMKERRLAPAETELLDTRKIPRLLEELGDLPHLIDEYDISPSELRNYIKLVVRDHQSAYVTSRAGHTPPTSSS